jgi:RNA polymerase sigma factor (sigma-70 family)
MARLTLSTVLGSLGRSADAPPSQPTPDQELLARFLTEHDERAFAAIMERHAAMVLGVCKRILKNGHDAEDACQAVFLVLARKAASIRKTGSLAAWLHGVAWFVAHKLQTRLARTATHEHAAAAQQPTTSEPADISWREVQRLVDDELNQMPKIYQAALLLCYLEGRSQNEAARELGWSLGTLRGRLERGREMLRARLTRRGVTGASALAIAVLLPSGASAAVPSALITATAEASVPMAAGGAVPAQIPVHVALLTRDAQQMSLLTKLAIGALVSVCAVLVGWMTFIWANTSPNVEPVIVVQTGAEVWSETSRLEMPNKGIWSVAFSPDGKRIAAGAAGPDLRSGELRVWDAEAHNVLYALNTPSPVRCVVFAPDGQTLATSEHDGMTRLRDAKDGNVLFLMRGHKSQIDATAFSPDGKTLATTGWDGTVKLWDTATGKETQTLAGHRGQVFTVAFGRPMQNETGLVASGGVDRTARIWRPDTGAILFTLQGHTGVVHWLAFSPDGKTLATASWDKTVKLWDVGNGQLKATLHGHSESVHAVEFSPDGRTLASSAGVRLVKDMPGEIILWDLAAQKARARFQHVDRVYGLAFSPDSTTLATAGWDGTLRVWKQEPDRQLPVEEVRKNAKLQFVQAAAQPMGPEAPVPKKTYSEDFHPTLKGAAAEIPGLVKCGPDAADYVKFEPDGLRITLPNAYPKARPGTGVITDFGVKGDFEITVSLEILQEPNAGLGGNPTDLKLVVVPNEIAEAGVWHKSTQNRAGLAREAAGRGNFGGFMANATKWDPDLPKDQWGNENFSKIEVHDNKRIPAKAKAGRLRLIRSGPTLFYYSSEATDKDFGLLHRSEFGTKDLKNVRVIASTGGPQAVLDVRVTDLQIRADGFIKGSTPPAPSPVVEPAAVAGTNWGLIILAIAGPVVVIAAALGVFLFVWSRRRAMPNEELEDEDEPAEASPAAPPSNDAPAAMPSNDAPAAISFQCPHCEKRLKAKGERAGSKVKCPQCARPVLVPSSKSNAIRRSPSDD